MCPSIFFVILSKFGLLDSKISKKTRIDDYKTPCILGFILIIYSNRYCRAEFDQQRQILVIFLSLSRPPLYSHSLWYWLLTFDLLISYRFLSGTLKSLHYLLVLTTDWFKLLMFYKLPASFLYSLDISETLFNSLLYLSVYNIINHVLQTVWLIFKNLSRPQ